MSRTDAIAHLDEALDALTLEGFSYDPATGASERLPGIQCTLAVELERVDAALGPRGQSMFAPIAEEIKRAVIEIVAAKQALEADGGAGD